MAKVLLLEVFGANDKNFDKTTFLSHIPILIAKICSFAPFCHNLELREFYHIFVHLPFYQGVFEANGKKDKMDAICP